VANADGCSDNVYGDSSSNVVDVGFVREVVVGPDGAMLIPGSMSSKFIANSGNCPESPLLQIYYCLMD
jgi:hypothetical protein